MRIPKRITPCPIIEAIVEIRFEPEMPADAVFGVLYNEFKSEYKKVEKLPILQLPEFVRTQDPDLKIQPYYKLLRDNFILQIGPGVLSVVNVNQYIGWPVFSTRILDTLWRVNKLELVAKVTRLGIRYINFFESNIYENINLKFMLSDQPFIAEQITFRSTLTAGKFMANLHILNNGNITTNDVSKSGSLIDVDAYIQDEKEIDFSNIESLLEEGHLEEKQLFFRLLKEDFLQKFNPEY
ncbi:MAG: TIGR04255 family protein [Nitrosopumilaceae archaeon]